MKKYPFLLVVLALLFASAPDAISQTSDAKTAEEAVRKLERAWLDAYEQHDAKAMETIVANGFVITFPSGGKQTKQDIVDSMKRPPPAGESVKFRTEKTEARVFGDVVVLFGRVISENQRAGKSSTEEMLYTDTYVRRDGVWQVVASHLSAVPKPKPAP